MLKQSFYKDVFEVAIQIEYISDTVPGMDVEMENDFTQGLLKSIVIGMGVPYNYIDATMEVDFARTLTMVNNPFVRNIINMQEEFGKFYSSIIRALYKNEFMQDFTNATKGQVDKTKKSSYLSININNLELRFPTPIYLVLTNMNEQVQNAQQLTEFITLQYFPEDPTGQAGLDYNNELDKASFRRELYKNHFLPLLQWDSFDKIFAQVKQDGNKRKTKDNINFDANGKPKDELDMLEENEFD